MCQQFIFLQKGTISNNKFKYNFLKRPLLLATSAVQPLQANAIIGMVRVAMKSAFSLDQRNIRNMKLSRNANKAVPPF